MTLPQQRHSQSHVGRSGDLKARLETCARETGHDGSRAGRRGVLHAMKYGNGLSICEDQTLSQAFIVRQTNKEIEI